MTPSGDSGNRLKLTEDQFRTLVGEHLSGTFMGDVLIDTTLKTDPEGFVEPPVIDNIYRMLGVAARMSPDPTAKQAFETFRGVLGGSNAGQESR